MVTDTTSFFLNEREIGPRVAPFTNEERREFQDDVVIYAENMFRKRLSRSRYYRIYGYFLAAGTLYAGDIIDPNIFAVSNQFPGTSSNIARAAKRYSCRRCVSDLCYSPRLSDRRIRRRCDLKLKRYAHRINT